MGEKLRWKQTVGEMDDDGGGDDGGDDHSRRVASGIGLE